MNQQEIIKLIQQSIEHYNEGLIMSGECLNEIVGILCENYIKGE